MAEKKGKTRAAQPDAPVTPVRGLSETAGMESAAHAGRHAGDAAR